MADAWASRGGSTVKSLGRWSVRAALLAVLAVSTQGAGAGAFAATDAANRAVGPLAAQTVGTEFRGVGPDATAPLPLAAGLVVVTLEHDGASNFAVELYDEGGEYVELLANEIGPFSGQVAFALDDPGAYVMNVSADGAWRIVVERPEPTAGQPVPASLTGTGKSVSPFLALGAGLTRVAMTHDGSSNFAVVLYRADGEYIDLLANEIGPYDGAQVAPIDEPGLYILDIQADGNWRIDIEQ